MPNKQRSMFSFTFFSSRFSILRLLLTLCLLLTGTSLYSRKRTETPTGTPIKDSIVIHIDNTKYVLVRVEGGMFRMGGTAEQRTDPTSTDKPVHQVVLDSYYIGKTEVTRRLWKAVMGDAPTEGGNDWLADDMPQEWISWDDCQRFLHRLDSITGLSVRMPTEAEWEYAARGGRYSQHYKYAGGQDVTAVGWVYANSGKRTHAVAGLQANELGLYDFTGNVWEWCSDRYGLYPNSLQVNPQGHETGELRVVRGGSWDNATANVNLSTRQGRDPNYTFYDCGLRIALSAERTPIPPASLPEQKRIRLKGVQMRFHLVTGDSINPFYIAETEVTQAFWKALMHENPSAKKGNRNPVEDVSWDDCQRFIAILNHTTGMRLRLPTSAEWIYAAEGGQHSISRERLDGKTDSLSIAANRPKYITPRRRKAIKNANRFLDLISLKIKEPEDAILYDFRHERTDTVAWLYAGGDDPDKVAWYYANSKSRTHKVKSKQPNELGLYDMSGNVAEWTQEQCVHGGSWMQNQDNCRISSVQSCSPIVRTPYIGFRLVIDLTTELTLEQTNGLY